MRISYNARPGCLSKMVVSCAYALYTFANFLQLILENFLIFVGIDSYVCYVIVHTSRYQTKNVCYFTRIDTSIMVAYTRAKPYAPCIRIRYVCFW
jgi:hypothetical protein